MIDHIVIGAAHLDQTITIEQQFGAAFGGGGKHPMMATHNRLLKLQDDVYCEVIAVDPDAATDRPRWFSLDMPETEIKLRAVPRPLCWVWSVSDIDHAVATCGYDLGRIITMTRDDLQWRLTVADDGALAQSGILPILIEWPDGRNPANRMAESSVRLSRLVLTHPNPAMIADCLDRLGARNAVVLTLGVPAIAFHFDTPNGPVMLA
jgi:hypothetical protein